MVDLLDEYIPVIKGSELNDDPFNPLSRFAIDLILEKGDETPVEWMHSGTLSAREIPFGNHSPPYYPKNVEVLYTWALLPLREVVPLAVFQLVWLLLAGLALYDTFLLCGARGRAAALTATTTR